MSAARILASVLALAAVVSCSPDSPPTGGDTILVVVTPPTPRVQVGFQIQLTATVNGPPGVPQQVVWQALNETIATVNGSGLVQGIAEGEGIIRVRWASDVREFTDVSVLVSTTPIEEGRAGERAKGRAGSSQ